MYMEMQEIQNVKTILEKKAARHTFQVQKYINQDSVVLA